MSKPNKLVGRVGVCAVVLAGLPLLTGATDAPRATVAPPANAAAPARAAAPNAATPTVVPKPVHMSVGNGKFTLSKGSRIVADSAATGVAEQLAEDLRPATGYPLPVVQSGHDGGAHDGDIALVVGDPGTLRADTQHEGYQLTATTHGVTVEAPTAHGLFNGTQTIRQLLPASIASTKQQPGPWTVPTTSITDYPRYGYRGLMLDIARHYESPAAVEKLIDQAATYKINTFHLHLSDDQGFRIVINGFPNLTKIGGQGSVGTDGRTMDPGGYWTQADYRAVVAYAKARFVRVMPEVDTPGHNNAIIMSEYNDTTNPRLNGHPQDINCSANNPPQWDYTGDVGYSALCPESANTWTILNAIVSQLTAMSSSGYYDLGGDEVPTTILTQQRYAALVNKEFGVVTSNHKTPMGWADIAGAGTTPPAGSVAEYWNPASGSATGTETATEAVTKHMKIVMSPANHAYLDQKYAPGEPPNIGLTWACSKGCDVDQFYNWDPASYVDGVTDANVIGVEGAMWSETVRTIDEVDTMVLPRLLALSELGWSPKVDRTASSPAYADFLNRLGAQGPRFDAAGWAYFRSTEVPWR